VIENDTQLYVTENQIKRLKKAWKQLAKQKNMLELSLHAIESELEILQEQHDEYIRR
jgi:phage shock protein A